MATQVPKEYVRQQLKSMGINEISEQELDSYTRDFSRLIQEHLEHDSTSASDLSSLSETRTPASETPPTDHTMSTISSSSVSSVEHTPLNNHPHIPPSGSAVFKTFPGDKENKVTLLSPSLSPNSILLSPDKPNVSMTSVGSKVRDGTCGRRPIKRKVLRKCNGESRVFDESLNESVSPLVRGVSRQLSDMSLTSVSSTEGSVRVYVNSPSDDSQTGERIHCCKSFIRPPTSHPHMRGLKKCDPVQRYHEFRRIWDSQKPPGEKSRNSLRWHIREQLLHQDVPYFEPSRRVHKVNEFVVPTDKKRSSLRWEIRHQLAHQ